jgi:hypothetical protein
VRQLQLCRAQTVHQEHLQRAAAHEQLGLIRRDAEAADGRMLPLLLPLLLLLSWLLLLL